MEYRNECQIVFGGDCFDQFDTVFDDHSSNSTANLQNIEMIVK